jgi:hypothetical protein
MGLLNARAMSRTGSSAGRKKQREFETVRKSRFVEYLLELALYDVLSYIEIFGHAPTVNRRPKAGYKCHRKSQRDGPQDLHR